MEHITVTSRLMPVVLTQEGKDPLATPADWSDPFRGGMVCDHPDKLVAATTPAGHDLVIDPMSPLHAWGIVSDAMITIEGTVLPDTLTTAVDQVFSPG